MLQKLIRLISMENENEPELTGKQYLVCMLISILIVGFLACYADSVRKDSGVGQKSECSWECQGLLSRIKRADGWAVVNKKGNILLDQCTMINPLPEVTSVGTAIRKGEGLLFRIDFLSDSVSISTVAEISGISDISELYYNEFAIVKGKDGYGAISADGNWVVDPVYEKIDWDAVPYEDGTYGRKMIFQCWKNNNQEEVKWDPRDN